MPSERLYLKDSNKVFDIELQNATDVDIHLRTRYYQSMIDTDNLFKGEHYSKLPESFIIFICTYDPIGKNLPTYTFENRCIENLEISLKDKSVKKFFNATAYKQEKDLEISAFLEYICNQKTVDNFTTKIETLVTKIKQQEVNRKEYSTVNIHDQDNFLRGKKEGYIAGISQGLQQGLQQGISQGISQGEQQAKIETAKNLLSMALSFENIAKATGISLDAIQKLAEEQNSTNI